MHTWNALTILNTFQGTRHNSTMMLTRTAMWYQITHWNQEVTPLQSSTFCNAARVSCLETKKSTTWTIFFLNRAPTTWYIKQYSTIESSAFGSAFVPPNYCYTKERKGYNTDYECLVYPSKDLWIIFTTKERVVTNVDKPETTPGRNIRSLVAYH